MNRLAAIPIFIGVAAACGDNQAPPDAADPFASLPAIANEAFDCRANSTPERVSTVSHGCFFDVDCEDLVVVGHRGAGGDFSLYAPENSLSGLRLAMLLGAEAAEIDVRDSADGDLIVMHDGSTERTTGVSLEVGQTSSAELQALPLLADGFSGDFGCETVPRFADVLELVRDRLILVVDTKTSRGDLVAEAIRDANMLDQAVVSVGSPNTALVARAAVPEVRIQLRPNSVPEYEEMLASFARPPEILEVPVKELGAFAPIAAATPAKLFVDIFVEDALVLATGDFAEYEPPIEGRAEIAQTEFPMFFLEHLGRRRWSSLPANRDIGFESPLLP